MGTSWGLFLLPWPSKDARSEDKNIHKHWSEKAFLPSSFPPLLAYSLFAGVSDSPFFKRKKVFLFSDEWVTSGTLNNFLWIHWDFPELPTSETGASQNSFFSLFHLFHLLSYDDIIPHFLCFVKPFFKNFLKISKNFFIGGVFPWWLWEKAPKKAF